MVTGREISLATLMGFTVKALNNAVLSDMGVFTHTFPSRDEKNFKQSRKCKKTQESKKIRAKQREAPKLLPPQIR